MPVPTRLMRMGVLIASIVTVAAVLPLAFSTPDSAAAAAFTIQKIVDNDEVMPGSTEKFGFNGSDVPAIDGGRVVFGNEKNKTVWTAHADGTALTKVTGPETPVPPGGTENFLMEDGQDVTISKIHTGTVVFVGARQAAGGIGIYAVPAQGGPVTKLVDRDDFLPGSTTEKFHQFAGGPAFDASTGKVVFENRQELYTVPIKGGTVTALTGEQDVGHVSPCCIFDSPDMSSATVVFRNSNVYGAAAIFSLNVNGDPLSALAIGVGGTPTPGAPSPDYVFDTFTFSQPAIDLGIVVFRAASNLISQPNHDTLDGIYASIRGKLIKLVDTNTPVPGGTGNFHVPNGFTRIAFSKGVVVFQGQDEALQNGLYAVPATGGDIVKVIARGDQVDGDPVVGDPVMRRESLSRDQLALRLQVGSREGVYVVNGLSCVRRDRC